MAVDVAQDRVVVATSDQEIGASLIKQLSENGYAATHVDRAEVLWDQLSSGPTRLLVLETHLREESGLELLRQLRNHQGYLSLPTIVLGGDSSVDKVSAFELGADDYVVIPPSMREFVLRVRAVLRRAVVSDQPSPAKTLNVGPLSIDTERYEVRVHQDLVRLTALEFRLLTYLAANSGQACPKSQKVSERFFLEGECAGSAGLVTGFGPWPGRASDVSPLQGKRSRH